MTESTGKILIIVENLPVPFDRRVWMEATTLRQAGYEISVISPAEEGYDAPYEVVDGIHIYRHPLPPEENSSMNYFREYVTALWWEWKLARRVRRERGLDVIHACNPPDLIFLVGMWFKLFYGVRFVFDHHDLNPELYESKFRRRGPLYRVLRCAERLTFAVADTVISTNEFYKEVATTRGRKRAADVFVVRSAPSLSVFKPVPPNPDYRRGRKYLVGYLGVMGPQDGVDHLLRAAYELVINRSRHDIQFCLIGTGPMFQKLQTQAQELGISEYIEFTGRLPDAEAIERLCTCDVCVNPDPLNPLNDKSTMNKVLEYMALARPIVQYDLREGRISAGHASLYAEPNNPLDLAAKIEQILASPDARTRMGQMGRQRMEESLEWKYQVRNLVEAYRRTLGR